jgi:FkbH-like protein
MQTNLVPEFLFKDDIRLVIWDLDETFWQGTLTEGGHKYIRRNHDLIVELARRGIMSSICSKNDFDQVKTVLQAEGIWDYFIFPSIDWTPKAHRIQRLIESIGLRPATVLFIDDNQQNLYQTLAEIPDINIAAPSIIPDLRTHQKLHGKADFDLSRLKQYKVLEQKQNDKGTIGSGNLEFLRRSNIKVYFEYEVENHIERVIELINRTNQLNFTKERLPEDFDEAKRVFFPFLRNPGTTAGLVRVTDNYGDYGFVGFYAMTEINRQYSLRHFCFSCRTLNMYIENFVYNFIGRPCLEVKGEVLSDLTSITPDVDWIEALPIDKLNVVENDRKIIKFDRMYARGGCDLMALMHYFSLNCANITGEFNGIKNWQYLRTDHSSFLYYALFGLTDAQLRAAGGLGYDIDDFKTAFPWNDPPPVLLLSFWADSDISVYRHGESGIELPYYLGGGTEDLISDVELAERLINQDVHRERVNQLCAEWEYIGPLTPAQMTERYRGFLRLIPKSSKVFMTLANERGKDFFLDESRPIAKNHRDYNVALREAAEGFENVVLIDIGSFIDGPDDLLDINHLRRDLYFKIYQNILSFL